MKKNYTVYKHIAPNGKIYIGQTGQKNPKRRWRRGEGYKPNAHFYNAIQKYGWDNIEHEIVATGLTKKEADWLEKYLIAFYETTDRTKGYNNTKGGDGSFEMTDEVKRKMSEAKLGVKKSDEHRKHLSEAHKRIGDFYVKIAAERTEKTDSIIADNYDYTKSVRENVEILKNKGFDISASRVYEWTKKNNIDTMKNDGRIKSLDFIDKVDLNLSIRGNMKALKEMGYENVTEHRVRRAINLLKN